MKKAALHNLGCKVNAYETEAMQQMLEQNGYEIVPFAPGADVYIINTCTVTNIADRKSRQMLHKAKKMNPNAIVVAAGCYVETGKRDAGVDETIDLLIGNNKKQELIRILDEYREGKACKEEMIDINHTKEYEPLMITKTGEHTRAYIKVQDGCNQFCSYCIIPFARGRVRSRSMEDVVKEVRALAGAGYQEVVLTGIHLSSYGVDFENPLSLLDLIKEVHEIDEIRRIRLGSLEAGIITEPFVKEISKLEKLCPHFHLSLQSGCDETLKRMNRRYRAGEYYEKCRLLRNYYENPALTTDVIVGFPMESEEEFLASKQFVDKIGFFETHIFKYSRREGTKAANMEGQISEGVKKQRSQELISLGLENQQAYLKSFLGKEVEILLEETIELNGIVYTTGHTKEYLKALVKQDEPKTNMIVKGIVEDVRKDGMILCYIKS